eukprot:Awhi_evm2s10111
MPKNGKKLTGPMNSSLIQKENSLRRDGKSLPELNRRSWAQTMIDLTASKGKISGIKKSDGTITHNGVEKRTAFANFYEKLGNEDANDERKYDSESKMLVEERVET